jgi:lambda family phage tail tape measure protein
MAQIGSLSVKLGLVTVDFDKATAAAKKSAKDLQSQFNDLGNRVKGLANDFKNAGIASLTIGMGALYHEAVALSDEVSDLSHSFGLSIPEVLAFRDALQSSGGKAENADKAISTLFGKLADARDGNDTAVAQFEKLGIAFGDLKKLSPYESIIRVADGFKNIGDQFERTKAIKDVFGKAGIGVSMDDISAALSKGTGEFDKYGNSLETVGQVADALHTNLQNLTVAFADLIAPFTKTHILTVQQFSDVLKGVGSAAVVLGIAAVAREILNVASAIRTAAAAGALFNLTAGIGSPIGLVLKAVTAMAAIGTFIYVTSEGKSSEQKQSDKTISDYEKAPLLQGKALLDARAARENAGYDARFSRGTGDASDARLSRSGLSLGEAPAKAADDVAKAVSKEAQARQMAVALTRNLMALDQKRADLSLKMLDNDTLSNRLSVMDLDAEQQIASIRAKAAQEKATADGKESAAMAAARDAQVAADVARVNQTRDNNKALERAKDKLAFKNLGGSTATDIAEQQAQLNAIDNLDKQTQAQIELNDATNQRMVYENSLNLMSADDRDLLMQKYDLEVKIADYKKQAAALDKPQNMIDSEVARLRATGQATIDINKLNKDSQKTFSYGWDKAFQDYKDNAFNAASQAAQTFQIFSKTMEDAIDNFVFAGGKSFKDFADNVIKQLIAIQLKKQALQIFDQGSAAAGNIISTGIKFLGFADGGNPPVNQASMVGERGPELFVPKTAGTIIPNNMLNASSNAPTINYNGPYIANMSAIDTQSGAQFLAKNKQAVWATYQSANRSIPMSR